MKILFLPSYFYPESYSSAHLDNDLYEHFSLLSIHMVAHVPMPSRGIDNKTRKSYYKKKTETLYNGFLELHRFSLFKESTGTLNRALRYALSLLIQFFKGLFTSKVDVIFLVSTPPIIGIVGGLLHKMKRIPFVYVVQDIFPDSLVHTGLSREGSIVWKIGRCIENFTYRNAEKIIVISESFKQNLLKKQVPENKIIVIPNWVNSEKVFPVIRERNQLVSKLEIDPNNFYITYCGNIGHTQNFELLLSVAKRLTDFSDIKIILFGDGAYLKELLETIKTANIANILHFPFQPYEDIASVFSLGNIGLIISKSGVSSNSVPSKTWSIMAAARPVLASFDMDSMLGDVICESNCGVIVPADNEDALYDAIIEMYNKRDTLCDLGNNGREYVKTRLSKEVCTRKYVEVIKEVTNT